MKNRLYELMTRDAEDEVIQSEILATVVNAARENLVMTQLLGMRIGPGSIPGDEVTIILATKDAMTVHEVGEGQEIPIDTEAYEHLTLKPVKYGVRPLITTEMQEDAKFDVIGRQLKEAGWQMAKKLDSLLIEALEAGATAAGHAVTGGAAITIDNITEAMNDIEADDYTPTDFIIHPNVAKDIRNIDTFVEADKAGITNPGKGLIGTIFGMKVWVTNQATTNYAYVIDRNYALVLAEKRPITIEKYDDVTRDMTGIAVTARWKAYYLRKEACAKITTT
ncbi:MAG: phage major capsid protein [Candidatus Heimdallarchaeota archaeon]